MASGVDIQKLILDKGEIHLSIRRGLNYGISTVDTHHILRHLPPSTEGEFVSSLSDGTPDSETPCDHDLDALDRRPWFDQIDASMHFPGECVGYCAAKVIYRCELAGMFRSEMNAFPNTSKLAFDIFNTVGRLSPAHTNLAGTETPIWRDVLDQRESHIVLLETIHVAPTFRRYGVGSRLIKAIFRMVSQRCGNKSLMYFEPEVTQEELLPVPDAGEWVRLRREGGQIVQFARSLGFRRVGTTTWFALAADPNHPSRRLVASMDWNPRHPPNPPTLPDFRQHVLFIHTSGSLSSRTSISDATCVEYLKMILSDPEDPLWVLSDSRGNSILHFAAAYCRYESINFLLSTCPGMALVENIQGLTPVKVLRAALDIQRTRSVDEQGTTHWWGFPPEAIYSLAALEGVDTVPLGSISNTRLLLIDWAADTGGDKAIRNTLRLKYGCTCGACIGGFMSPRTYHGLALEIRRRLKLMDKPDWHKS